jgi:hypothetical protein
MEELKNISLIDYSCKPGTEEISETGGSQLYYHTLVIYII